MNPPLPAAAAPQTTARTGDLRSMPTDEGAFDAALSRASQLEAEPVEEPREEVVPGQTPDPFTGEAKADLTGFGWAPALDAPAKFAEMPDEDPPEAEPLFVAPAQLAAVEFKPDPTAQLGTAGVPSQPTGGARHAFGTSWSFSPAAGAETNAAGAGTESGSVSPGPSAAAEGKFGSAGAPAVAASEAQPAPAAKPEAAQHVAAVAVEAAQETSHRLSDAIVLERNTAAPASAAADLGMNVWADRLRAQAPAETAEAQAEAEADGEAPATTTLPAQTQNSGSEAGTGEGHEQASTPTMTVSKPEESAAKFQIPTVAVDTSSSPGEAKLEHLHTRPTAKVAVAVEEIVRGRSSVSKTNASARVEVEVDGQRISVRVQVRDGRVDVEIAGMDPAELAALKDDLGERLRGHELTLGDLTQDTGTGSREQGEAQEAADADAQGAQGDDGPDKSVEAARLRHDGAVYVTA